jgi:AAA domain-containing protein
MTAQHFSELPDQTDVVAIDDQPDACLVSIVDVDHDLVWYFRFTRIQPTYAQLHALVSVTWAPRSEKMLPHAVPMPRAPFQPLHCDWRSGSSKETLERRIRNYFDPGKKNGTPWARLVEFAAARLNDFLADAGDLEEPTWVDAPQELVRRYYIKPIWPESKRPVIWYGQGETGKGVMAIGAAFDLCLGRAFATLGSRYLKRGLVYVDYEDSFGEFNLRINRYAAGLEVAPVNTLRRFDPHGRLFIDIVHTLRAKVEAMGGCDGYIIDSAIPACGGDVIKPEPVGAFFSALALLNRPSIVIAHETKESPTSSASPFGSQLWRTLSAMTVNFQASSEPRRDLEGNAVRDLVISCTKANNVPRFNPLAFELSFSPDDEDRRQPELISPPGTPSVWTRIRQINPTEVAPDLQAKLSPTLQLIAVLREGGGATIKDLAEATGLDRKTVDNALRRSNRFVSEGGGKGRNNLAIWRLKGETGGSNGYHP